MKKRRFAARMTAGLLAVLMTVSLPLESLASISATKGNTRSENEKLLETVKGMGLDDTTAAAVCQKLLESGLCDENGRLVTKSLVLDGKTLTLEEARKLVENPDTDLNRMVTVDGESLPLKDLKVMLDIEDELARLQATYFGEDVELTPELQDMLRQFGTEGLEARGFADVSNLSLDAGEGDAAEQLKFGSQIDHTVALEVSSVVRSTDVEVTFRLTKKQNADVTFRVDTVDGSAVGGVDFEAVSNQTMVIKTTDKTPEVKLRIKRLDTTKTDTTERWNGDKTFLVQVSDVVNAVLPEGKRAVSLPVELGDSFDFSLFSNQKEIPYGKAPSPSGAQVNIENVPNEQKYLVRKGYVDFKLPPNMPQYQTKRPVHGNGEDDQYPRNLIQTWYNIGQDIVYVEALLDTDTVITVWDDYSSKQTVIERQQNYTGLKEKFKKEFGIRTVIDPSGWGDETLQGYDTPDWMFFDLAGQHLLGRMNFRKRLNGLYKELGYDPDKPLEAIYNLSPEARRELTIRKCYNIKLDPVKVSFQEFAKRAIGGSKRTLEFKDKGNPYGTMIWGFGLEFLLVPTIRLDHTVSAPAGNYPTGSTLPIVVEFSQPVKASSVVITVKDEDGKNVQELSPMESAETISTRLTFPYPVKSAENGNIFVSAGTAADNGTSRIRAYSGLDIDWTLKDSLINCGEGHSYRDTYTLQDALSPLTIDKESYSPDDQTARIAMQMPEDGTLRDMLLSALTSKDGEFFSGSLGISLNGGETMYPLKFVDASGNSTSDNPQGMVAEIPLEPNIKDAAISEAAELYQLAGAGREQTLQLGYYQTVTRNPAVYLTGADLEIVYPAGADSVFYDETHQDNTVFAGDPPAKELLKLDFNIRKADATWKDKETQFEWSSSDEAIAVIDKVTGQISLTGGTGKVTFTLTALNGGHNDMSNIARYQAVAEKSLVAVEGNNPYLSIPDSLSRITVKTGSPVTVRWATNLFDKNSQAPRGPGTSLILKVYKAEYKAGSLLPIEKLSILSGPITITGTREKPVYQYNLDGLDAISLGTQASYVVTVEGSSVDGIPGVAGGAKKFTAQTLVYVRAKPATVQLTRPENLFLTTEAGSVQLPWSVANLDRVNQGEFALTITDNTTGKNVISLDSSAAAQKDSGEVNFDLKTNGQFCTIYTVEAKARNRQDDAWSRDSFVLYVYDADALDILVDGEKQPDGGTHTLSNRDRISSLYRGGSGQQAILDLERDINLQEVISINYGEHAWTELADRMQWKVTPEEEGKTPSASVNYLLGSQYRNINGLASLSYAPTEEFLLSGSRDGTSKVTVNHALAGEGFGKSLDVDVETLTDKLYLFQLHPAQATAITYTNGDGDQKTVTSEADGRAAIYEESGIKGEIYLRAETDDAVYLGTLYAGQLNTGERDAVSMELYPLNNMVLRKQGEVPVSFKNPDGSAYTGTIKVRGGVLLNDKYIETVNIDQDHPGTGDYTLNLGSSGSHTFTFDLTQSGVEVKDTDKLSFLFEIRPDGDYYPVFLEYNGRLNENEAVKLGEGIVNLEKVPEGGKNQPFIATQRLRFSENRHAYSESIKGRKGKIGPSTSYPEAYIETNVLWWGTQAGDGPDSRRAISLTDQDGKVPVGQTTELVEYAFSTMPLTRNTLCLNKTNLETWGIGSLETRGLTLRYTDPDGSIRKKEDLGVRVMNAFAIEDATSSTKLTAMLGEIGQKAGGGKDSLGTLGSGFISVGIAAATKVGVDTPFLKLKLAPTSDPTVFKGLVFVGADNMTGDNISGMDPDLDRVTDLDFAPSLFDIMEADKLGGVGKYASAKGKQLDYAGNILSQNRKQAQATGTSMSKSKDGKVSFNMTGYFESEVYYDYDDGQWKMEILNGGLSVGGGYGYDWSWNWFVGPVPVIAQLGLGASVLVDYKLAANHMAQGGTDMDYLLELRVMAYIRAFAGVGFDYAIVALKVGLFGQVSLDARMDFLWRYDKPYDTEFAYKVQGTGTIGIEFAVKVLFFSYEAVLWGTTIDLGKTESNNWDSVQRYWAEVGKGLSGNDYTMMNSRSGARMAMPLAYDAEEGTAIYAVQQEARLEDRDYLENYERTWEGDRKKGFLNKLRMSPVGKFFLGEVKTPATETICDNAYPYAEPKVSDDGKLLALLTDQGSSDVTKTRAAYMTEGQGGGYSVPGLIDDSREDGYGDSQLSMAGTGDFAVAAWSRVMEEPPKKEGGSLVTESEQSAMMQSTDVMASVYRNGTWETAQLTDAAGADMAPVAATAQVTAEDGTTADRAIVAWRSVAGTDESRLTSFDATDDILYRVYDGKEWSEARRIYNGTSGSVMGIQAAMMPDGTAAVTYTVDTGIGGRDGETAVIDEETGTISSGLELFYSVINTDSVVEGWNEEKNKEAGADPVDSTMRTVRLTSDTYADENPQIAAVTVGSEERFILGWHSIQSSDGTQKEDIRLRSIDGKGLIDNRFPNSLSELTMNSDVFISGNFQFSRGAKTIEDLSVLWRQAAREITESGETSGEQEPLTADHDILNGIRFRAPETENGSVSVTAAQTLYEMGAGTTIDTFSGYTAEDGSLQTIVLGTVYDMEESEKVEVSYGFDEHGNERKETVYVPLKKAVLCRAGGSYTETFVVDSVMPEYASIYTGARVPVQVSVRNMGTKPVNRVTMQIGGAKGQTIVWDASGASSGTGVETGSIPMKAIAPGEARMLTGYYQVPDSIRNVSYQVKAVLEGGEEIEADEGTLVLDVPDLGIAGLRLSGEEDGKRTISMNLYNGSQSRLAGASDGRYVKVGIYQDAECTQQVDSQYLEEIQTRAASQSYLKLIDDQADLAQIDAGSYTLQYQFNVAEYIKQHGTDSEGNPTEETPYASESGEIRDGGITLYVKAWIEQTDKTTGETGELAEYCTSNNGDGIRIRSLLEQADGEPVSMSVTVSNEEGQQNPAITALLQKLDASKQNAPAGTRADVILQNNSIQQKSSGNLIATLYDGKGAVIETKQLYDPAKTGTGENFGLISMGPEQKVRRTIQFAQKGQDVKVRYTDEKLEGGGDQLAALKISTLKPDGQSENGEETEDVLARIHEAEVPGTPGTYMITLETENAQSINVDAEAENKLQSAVTLNGGAGTNGIAIGSVPARPGTVSQIIVTVSTPEGQPAGQTAGQTTGQTTKRTYIINVVNRRKQEDQKDREATAVPEGQKGGDES